MAQALMLAIGGILTGVLNLLVGNVFKEDMPWIIQRLLVLATKCLPEPQQERFAEEWTSHVNDVPGDIRKVLFAWGCVCAARDMAALSTAGKTNVGRVWNRSVELLRACTIEEMATLAKSSHTLIREGMHVKVGPTRQDGKPHPHAGKTGRITRFINIYSDPYWLGPPSAMIRLDSEINPRGFIWVSLANLEVLPEIVLPIVLPVESGPHGFFPPGFLAVILFLFATVVLAFVLLALGFPRA